MGTAGSHERHARDPCLPGLCRAALGAGNTDWSLGEEVERTERYLATESLRLGDRPQIAWHERKPLPRLLLQPLPLIEIAMHADSDDLRVSVRHPHARAVPAATKLAHGMRNTASATAWPMHLVRRRA